MTRREFGALIGSSPVLRLTTARAQSPGSTATMGATDKAATPIRAATGLRAALQSLIWISAEAGLFRHHDLEVSLTTETGGPRAASGTLRGDWAFCHTGDLPIVQGAAQGQDLVMILTPAEPHDAAFLMGGRAIARPEQLAGTRVGALDATGQFGRAAGTMLQGWGISARLVSLGSFRAIYQALGRGEIDAGYLPVDLRFLGENEYGWHALGGISSGAGGIVTTRRLIDSDRDLVLRIVASLVDAIALFKTQPEVIVPLLQRYLEIDDRRSVEQLHAYYAPLLRAAPLPTFFDEMPRLRSLVAPQYPAATTLAAGSMLDPSFVDELNHGGYIARLYPATK